MAMKSGKGNRLPEGDDGRTIANMNVEGMPWYTPGETSKEPAQDSQETKKNRYETGPAMTGLESRYYTWGALKAALLVVGVICAGIILFILFCTKVWFR